jgi:CheY-like chemotaxis protein
MPGKKLLVADDSLTIQKVIRLALSNEGYEIQAISDGAECIQQISTFRPDAVLIDVSLPTRSAFEIKREVNGLEDHANVKFILMSSAFEKIDETQASEVGFDGHLTKPFDPAHLRQVLNEVLAAPPKHAQVQKPALSSPPPGPPPGPPSAPAHHGFEMDPIDKTKTGISLDLPLDFPASGFQISEFSKTLPDFSPPPPPATPSQSGTEVSDEEELWGTHEEETPPPLPPSNPVTASRPSSSTGSGGSSTGGQDDIRQLTESTIRMTGLADMPSLSQGPESSEISDDSDWKVNEPSLRPPGSLSDLGGSSFHISQSRSQSQTPPPPVNPFSFEQSSSSPTEHRPEIDEEMRRQVQETLQAMVEKMARQILPEVAERVIKAEINKLLNEKL